MNGANHGWYQIRFLALARQVFDERGRTPSGDCGRSANQPIPAADPRGLTTCSTEH
jgi:hypothetical protein